MIGYENFFGFSQNCLSKTKLKNSLINNHYKVIYGPSDVSALPAGCSKYLQKKLVNICTSLLCSQVDVDFP